MYSLTYNTLNMAIWRKWPKSQSTHCATSTHLSGLARAPRTPSQKPRGSARMQLGPVHARPASRHPHDASIKSFCHLLMPAGGCPCIAPQDDGVALVQRVRGDISDCRRTASGRTSASEHSDVSHDVGHHTFTVGGLRMTNGSPGGQRMHVRRRAWAGETRNCSAYGRCHLRCHLRARSMPHLHDAAPPTTLQMHGKCAKMPCGLG